MVLLSAGRSICTLPIKGVGEEESALSLHLRLRKVSPVRLHSTLFLNVLSLSQGVYLAYHLFPFSSAADHTENSAVDGAVLFLLRLQ